MANEMRLIDAVELEKSYQFTEDHTSKLTSWTITDILNILDEAPTVEAAPVVHGFWINGNCSACGAPIPTDSRVDFISEGENEFCYSCGAKMDGA